MHNILGNYIHRKRDALGLSLRKFAEKCELSHTHIDSIEKGMDFRTGKQVRVTTETVEKIAKALDISFEILSALSLPSTKDKFEFYYDYIEREEMKASANEVLSSSLSNVPQKLNAAEQIFKAYYSRSIENCKFDIRHVSYSTFVSMLLNQKFWKNKLPSDIYDLLVSEYGTSTGIPEGQTYYLLDAANTNVIPLAPSALILDYTKHEQKVIRAYRNQPDMQPAVDKILGVSSEPDYLMPVAAHNDNQSSDQLEKMERDLDKF